jgi:DNA-binding NarL/FixJ family response regulator
MSPVTVLIVDDNIFVRSGLVAALERADDIQVVGVAENGHEAWQEAQELIPDVVLMDVRMRDMDGIEATRAITAALPHCRVLMVTWSDEPDDLIRAILAGAKGYLVHGHFGTEELVDAIHTIHEGGALITPSVAPHLLRLMRERLPAGDLSHPILDPLTQREFQVLERIGKGSTNRQIAEELGLSEKTVKNHINNIYSKLHIQSRLEARLRAAELRGPAAD